MRAPTGTDGPPRVLVVEDEDDVQRVLAFNLRAAGYDVLTAGSIAEALVIVESAPTVAIVDRMLPDGDGLLLCEKLRAGATGIELGILVLTARGSEDDRVEGFEAGVDDYVVKPFSIREVLGRVRVLAELAADRLRARTKGSDGAVLRNGSLVVELGRHRVLDEDSVIELRPIELAILATILREPRRTFSRSDLLRLIWGDATAASPRAINVHVSRLRERLGKHAEVIETVHGWGYRARPPPR